MKIGYARVSTRDQKADLQMDALKKAGCERIYTDVASGAKTARPELDKMLTDARKDDVIVIWKLDRLGRSLRHLVELVGDLSGRGVGLQSLNDPVNTTTSQGRLVFNIFASLAEFERELIRERTQAGLTAARVRGRLGGRPKGLSSQAESTAMAAETLYREGRLSVNAIGRQLNISKSTLYRYLQHRGVKIGAYQKNAKSEEANERITAIHIRIMIEDNSGFVRGGKKKAREAVERFFLNVYGMEKLDSLTYLVKVPFRDEKELDKQVKDLLSKIWQKVNDHNCQSEIDAWEEGTERTW
jgi:DNA invertase Pin-like site-specific DNA recombinase